MGVGEFPCESRWILSGLTLPTAHGQPPLVLAGSSFTRAPGFVQMVNFLAHLPTVHV